MEVHPEAEEIAAYLDGRLAPDERTALEGHLAECAECRRVAAESGILLRTETRRRTRRRWLAGAPLVAAAAIAVILFVTSPAGEEGGPVPSAFRSGTNGDPEGLPTIEALLPHDEELVHPDSVRFAWGGVTADAVYRLSVTDEAGAAVWETTSADTAIDTPDEIRFEAGRRYFWYVDALAPDGNVASTGVGEFRTRSARSP